MKIDNPIYRNIPIKWNTITLPLVAGTPINFGGTVSNDGKAIGIIPQTITEKPVFADTLLLVGGDVQLCDVPYDLSSDAILAMDGIRFFGADGTPKEKPGYTLPTASTTAKGGVKMAAKVSDATGETDIVAQFNALLAAMKTAGLMASK